MATVLISGISISGNNGDLNYETREKDIIINCQQLGQERTIDATAALQSVVYFGV